MLASVILSRIIPQSAIARLNASCVDLLQISELVFRILIPQHKGDELMQLFEFLRTCIFARLDGHFESGTQQLEVREHKRWTRQVPVSHIMLRQHMLASRFQRLRTCLRAVSQSNHGGSKLQGPFTALIWYISLLL